MNTAWSLIQPNTASSTKTPARTASANRVVRPIRSRLKILFRLKCLLAPDATAETLDTVPETAATASDARARIQTSANASTNPDDSGSQSHSYPAKHHRPINAAKART